MFKKLVTILGILIIITITGCKENFSKTSTKEKYIFERAWGCKGSDDGQFNQIQSIAISPDDNIYIVDTVNNCIQKFDSNGVFLNKLNRLNYKNIEFQKITDITVDTLNNIYIGEFLDNQIKKIDSNQTAVEFISTIKGSIRPINIVIDQENNLYASTGGGIVKFNPEGACIKIWLVTVFPPNVVLKSEAESISDIAVDKENNIFVLHNVTPRAGGWQAPGYGKILRYEASIMKFNSNGKLLSHWEFCGNFSQLKCYKEGIKEDFPHLKSLAVDGDGDLFITNYDNNCIWKVNSGGNVVSEWGTEGTGDGEFKNPDDIEIDSKGNIYVVDSGNYRIQKFALTKIIEEE